MDPRWTTPAKHYIARVRRELDRATWLKEDFASTTPPCDVMYGCSGEEPVAD